MSKDAKKCYNCGVLMNPPNTLPLETSQTREHIPAKNLFVGYPEVYKVNRITVPGCKKCNAEYSAIDDEMRDAIGVMNEDNDLQDEITKKAIKNMAQKKTLIKNATKTEDDRLAFVFNYEPFFRYNLKNFKGIFYHKIGCPFPESDYGLHTMFAKDGDKTDQDFMTKYGDQLYHEIVKNAQWEHSGHPDIFQYLIKGINISDDGKCTFTDDIKDSKFIMCICKYHNKIDMIAMAFKRDFFSVPEGM